MEISAYIGNLLALLLIISTLTSISSGCVPGCRCTMVGSPKRQKGRKVDCAEHSAAFKTLAGINFPLDIVQLNLAHNALVILKQASFIQLSGLQKLNLSSNQITVIEPGAFDGLQSLKKLDLSRNLIGTINGNMFSGLPKLEKLSLSNNRIAVIPDGTFNDLRSLKRIEFKSDYLHCDCHLKWILKWATTRHVRLPGSTVCALPAKLKGQTLSKLKQKDLNCDHKTQLPIFDIRPSESQLVFQGDKLPFECHASVTPGKMEIAWFRGGQLVTTNKTIGVYVHMSHNLDHTVIIHRLVVERLDSSHAGEWSCVVTTSTGNLTKTVHVEVRTPEVLLECPSVTNHTAKGVYTWDKSMAGLLVPQPCQKGEAGAMATHRCGMDGRWKNLNTSSCNFLKDITRKLARFAKLDPGIVDITPLIQGTNKALENAAHMDSYDIFYMSKIMDNLLPYAATNTEAASLLANLVSNVSSLPAQVVKMAHKEGRSPLRMVKMLEQMSENIISQTDNLEWKIFSENVAVVVLNQHVLQSGLSCAVMGSTDSLEQGFTGSNLFCSRVVAQMQNIQVYIHIPMSLADKSRDMVVGPRVASSPPASGSGPSWNTTESSIPEDVGNFSLPLNGTSSSSSVVDSMSVPFKDMNTDSQEPELDLTSTGHPHNRHHSPDFPSLTLNENQLEALNISSLYFSKFSKPVNISSKTLLSLPSSLDMSARHLFPFVKSSVTPTVPATRQTNVYIILYRNGRLFPVEQSEQSDSAFRQGNWAVVTPVVAISTGGRTQNLSHPIIVTFTVSDTRKPIRAAYFDFDIFNGYGGWSTDGCDIVQQNGSAITVRVRHLSNFALLQDISYVVRLASFPMEPVIFVGSGVCICCMIAVITTFITCFGSIGIPKKIKHAVVNVCMSTLLLAVTFIFGINRTEIELPCQIAGILIHYLTLCTIFWITVTTNIIYKKFMKASRPPEPPPDLILMPLPPKPILQFYFVGYGVPVIICGITAAVNLNNYSGLQYCFLEWEPSLGAFYAPVALLVAWNLVLFMRISCIVKSISETESDKASENDNEIHTNEIELVPSQPDTITTTSTPHNKNPSKTNNNISNNAVTGYYRQYSRASSDNDEDEDVVSVKSIPDQERSPVSQLKSLIIILFLFIVMWMCGALAIAKPLYHVVPYLENIFSYIYGLMSSLFGIYMILYFCVTRKDAWLSWKQAGRCASPETYTVPMEVTEKASELPKSPQPLANGNIVKSNSSSNLSTYSQKSSNITKAYNMKNNSNSKQSNINLIIPNSSDTSFGSAQDNFPNFYNARQNGAAKKFWHKNRHHSKIMNKDINRELNSSLTDNSAAELSQRLSNGTSSDANTHLSIEIQIQAKDKEGSFSGSKEIPVHINNYQQANFQNTFGSAYGNMSVEYKGQNMGMSNAPDANLDKLQVSLGESSHLPQQSPGGSLGTGIHHSAFVPVPPRSSSNLPTHDKPEEEDGEGVQKRPGEIKESGNQLSGCISQVDGQSQGNEAGQRPPNPGVAWNPLHSNLPPLPNHPAAYTFNPPTSAFSQQHYSHGIFSQSGPVNPNVFNINQTCPTGMSPTSFNHQHGHLPAFNIPPSPYLIQSQSRGPAQSMTTESSSSQSQSNRKRSSSGSWYPISGGDSSDSCRPRKKMTGESPGRTVTYAPHSPVQSDSQAYESSYKGNDNDPQGTNKTRSMDSDHHSDPTHRKKPHRFDRHSKNKLTNKQRSLGWEEQFKGRPSKVNYVYINHMYRDKVMHKLIKQASESDDLAKKAFWLPRSASEYERLTQKGFCNMADNSSSSSDEDDSLDDNVWIRHSMGSGFQKKETSV